jgi:membrane-anchored glycerophosphoryl diester phosphodiesterase (GDPDase)
MTDNPKGRWFDKTSIMIFTIGLIFIYMLCVWAVDMSVTALMLQSAGLQATLNNGWMLQNPALIYHLALYMMIFINIVVVYIAMLNLSRRKDIPWLPLFRPKEKKDSIPSGLLKSQLIKERRN